MRRITIGGAHPGDVRNVVSGEMLTDRISKRDRSALEAAKPGDVVQFRLYERNARGALVLDPATYTPAFDTVDARVVEDPVAALVAEATSAMERAR